MLDRFISRKKKAELTPIIPPPGGADAQYLFAQSLSNSGEKAKSASSAVKPKPELKPERR